MRRSTARAGRKPKAALTGPRKTSPTSSGGSDTAARTWTTTQLSRNVFQVQVPIREHKDWEFWALLVADQHHDNPHADHALELKHLREARERRAAIVSAGDTFCAMQGKYDKRASKSAVRPEHQVDNYLDALVDTGAEFYEPFAHNFVCFGVGNHEQAIADRHETRLIDRLVAVLNDRVGSRIYVGGFSGWVVFRFHRAGEGAGDRSTRVVLHYDHGYGGGGPVTDDMIQHQRRAVYLPDADIVMSGHTHGAFMRELARVRLNRDGTLRHDIQTHIKTPSYKDEYRDGFGGWAVASKGMPPKPLGAWWLHFTWSHEKQRVLYTAMRAQ